MRMTVRYPIHFTAQPPTTDRVKDALCSFEHSVDIPEISEGETNPVAEMRFDGNDGGHNWTVSLKEYRGDLYKSLGKDTDPHYAAVFANPFECTLDRNIPTLLLGPNGSIPRPLGLPMWNRITHRLYVEGGRTREEYAWPPAPFNNSLRARWTRNEYRYESLARRTGPIDEGMFERCRDEHRAEAGKLVIIGGDVHVRTPPLAWAVSGGIHGAYVGVDMDIAYVPEWLDAKLDRQYFPLSMKEEALEYARVLEAHINADYTLGIVENSFDSEVDKAMPALSGIDFDHRSYTSNRNIMLIACDVRKVLNDRPALADTLGDGIADAVNTVADAALSLGAEINGWTDVAVYAEEVMSAWRTTGRRAAWAQIPSTRSKVGEMVCRHTLDVIAEMPISLAVSNVRGYAR